MRRRIIDYAIKSRLPAMYFGSEFPDEGGHLRTGVKPSLCSDLNCFILPEICGRVSSKEVVGITSPAECHTSAVA